MLICIDAIRNGRAASLFWFYPVTGKFFFLVSSTSYKPSDSKSFILCEQFHIWLNRLRDSAADRWFSLFLKTCHLAFPHMTCRMFFCHYWHPFRSAFMLTVSSHVVVSGVLLCRLWQKGTCLLWML